MIPPTLLPWIKKTIAASGDLARFEELAAHFEYEEDWTKEEAEILAWVNLLRQERLKKD